MIDGHMQSSMSKKPNFCGCEGDHTVMHQSGYFIILIQISRTNINRIKKKNPTKHDSVLLKIHTTPEVQI